MAESFVDLCVMVDSITNIQNGFIDLGIIECDGEKVPIYEILGLVENQLNPALPAMVLKTLFMGILKLQHNLGTPNTEALARVDPSVLEESIFGKGHYGKEHFDEMDLFTKIELGEKAVQNVDIAIVKVVSFGYSDKTLPETCCYIHIEANGYYRSDEGFAVGYSDYISFYPPNRRFTCGFFETIGQRESRYSRNK